MIWSFSRCFVACFLYGAYDRQSRYHRAHVETDIEAAGFRLRH